MDIIKVLEREIKKEISSSKLPVLIAYLYGSYAKGRERKGSDIDIAVLIEEDAYSKDALCFQGTPGYGRKDGKVHKERGGPPNPQ